MTMSLWLRIVGARIRADRRRCASCERKDFTSCRWNGRRTTTRYLHGAMSRYPCWCRFCMQQNVKRRPISGSRFTDGESSGIFALQTASRMWLDSFSTARCASAFDAAGFRFRNVKSSCPLWLALPRPKQAYERGTSAIAINWHTVCSVALVGVQALILAPVPTQIALALHS
jgi:hypothetical protein